LLSAGLGRRKLPPLPGALRFFPIRLSESGETELHDSALPDVPFNMDNNFPTPWFKRPLFFNLTAFFIFSAIAGFLVFTNSKSLPFDTKRETYTNSQHNFKFKYPQYMSLGEETLASGEAALWRRTLMDSNGKVVGDFSVRSASSDTFKFWEYISGGEAEDKTVAGRKAKKLEWVTSKSSDAPSYYNLKVFIDKGDLVYTASFSIDNADPQKQEMVKDFNNILSSFKFLN
jgi:hypothetical protein